MPQANAPLSVEGRRWLVKRCQPRAIFHVAAEMGLSRECANKAKIWFAAHGINHIHRVLTDRGACPRSGDFARIVGQGTRHQRTTPYTPRHNGKVERWQRIIAEEVLYAREFTSENARSAAIAVWYIHYNYHRPHSAAAGKPPAARLRESVTNVEPSYT